MMHSYIKRQTFNQMHFLLVPYILDNMRHPKIDWLDIPIRNFILDAILGKRNSWQKRKTTRSLAGFLVLWHVDPLLGNDRERNSYIIAITE
jgi:hypothetical protein